MPDTMTPRDRLLGALRGDHVDRVPLELAGFHVARRADIEKMPDPRKRLIAQRIFDDTHHYVGVPSCTNRMLMTPNQFIRRETKELADGCRRTSGVIEIPGGDLTFESMYDPHANTGWQVKYPVETFADIDRIASVAWELPPNLRCPQARAFDGELAGRGVLETRISSPFVCVAGMMSYQWFLELSLTEPKLIAELTDICCQRTLACVDVLFAEPAIEYVWLGGSEWVTPPMGAPSIYDALVQEQEREIIELIHARSNAVVHIHCHGHVRHALQRVIERGGDYTEPVEPPPDGDVTMAEAKQLAAGRVTLGGNVECRILCNESEEAVDTATRAAFEGGKQRFVLRPTEGPSPQISDQEFRNYMRMIDVWEELAEV
ncbi:MAG: hypothetical protein HN742_35645 [Lentisphaerae bacterium]|jgi:hypothetical protein|nr:hypothetical protein [Lentisphaerota bacterium]MBT4815089.1 hypothetical protein [Lentisphaerota bacterium]MBT5608968.1 hypothetical protein [Lentisphaerota bacterium]MBT7057527.1 hypothetical protein [Lentisphaerota bacterium]MBT7847259.1 hypothetical protein [Lentisphaerota bacterium]